VNTFNDKESAQAFAEVMQGVVNGIRNGTLRVQVGNIDYTSRFDEVVDGGAGLIQQPRFGGTKNVVINARLTSGAPFDAVTIKVKKTAKRKKKRATKRPVKRRKKK